MSSQFQVRAEREGNLEITALGLISSFSRAEHSGAPQTSTLSMRKYLRNGTANIVINASFGTTCKHHENTKSRCVPLHFKDSVLQIFVIVNTPQLPQKVTF